MAFAPAGRHEDTADDAPMAEINVTPLVDMVRVLPIVFMARGPASPLLQPQVPSKEEAAIAPNSQHGTTARPRLGRRPHARPASGACGGTAAPCTPATRARLRAGRRLPSQSPPCRS